MDEYDNNDYGTEFDEYNDTDATSCATGDYNEFEERELARDNEGEMSDQLFDMEMEDRIGGTGYLDCE
jgi:hypothetical protein